MVSMSPRKAAPKHITLPSRVLSLTRSRGGSSDSDCGPSTPAPRTPLAFSVDYVDGALCIDGSYGENNTPSSFKRQREDDEGDGSEMGDESGDWSQEELEWVRATFNHPLRPLSSPYPPGEMAPPHILDEITFQIMNSNPPSSRSPRQGASSSSSTEWTHSWDSTRKRVYAASVAATRAARGLDQEKLPMEERILRPSLRRMDSMDFLDQLSDDGSESVEGDGQENESSSRRRSSRINRTIRLSTCLQNSTKQTAPALTRAPSLGSAEMGLACLSTNSGPSSPIMAPNLTLTPASPIAPLPSSISKAPSIRRSGRQPRPSLLQRGRSFTASDLGAEDSGPDSPGSPRPSSAAGVGGSLSGSRTAPTSPRAPMASLTALTAFTANPDTYTSTGTSRHANSSSLLAPASLALADAPLLLPPVDSRLRPQRPIRGAAPSSSEWSDSDDESRPRRVIKKLRPRVGKNGGAGIGRSGSMIGLNAGLSLGDGLRSPFEERGEVL